MTSSSDESNGLKSCCANLYELPLTRLLLGSSFHPGGLELTGRLASSVALGPGDIVLDLACGRGDTAFHLAKHYGADVTGLDYSQVQVDEAKTKSRSIRQGRRPAFLQGDAEDLPFGDEEFDVVFCECALCTFPHQGRAIREVRRVLKKGGVLAISDVVINRPIPKELQNVIGTILCVSGAPSRPQLVQFLEDGGFRRIRYRDVSDTLEKLISQVEGRLRRLSVETLGADVKSTESHGDLRSAGNVSAASIAWPPAMALQSEVRQSLLAARQFVEKKGLGYATFTARK